eukprot:c9934_g1_i2.p1 GENE.c9934_g1_i2~~c9934_g1_i2.p1  ORF type:complete len:170 (-),score=29.57 c9934_g1_i2:563-1072(-)
MFTSNVIRNDNKLIQELNILNFALRVSPNTFPIIFAREHVVLYLSSPPAQDIHITIGTLPSKEIDPHLTVVSSSNGPRWHGRPFTCQSTPANHTQLTWAFPLDPKIESLLQKFAHSAEIDYICDPSLLLRSLSVAAASWRDELIYMDAGGNDHRVHRNLSELCGRFQVE